MQSYVGQWPLCAQAVSKHPKNESFAAGTLTAMLKEASQGLYAH